MECEICSKKAVGKALIEGAEVFVCGSCSRGKFIERFPEPTKLPSKVKEEEEPQLIENWNLKLRQAREKLGLTQEEFALKLKEKTSLISKLERGEIKPSEKLIKKFEKELNLKLCE